MKKRATVLINLLFVLHCSGTVVIKFGEVDRTFNEGNKEATVLVTKSGLLPQDLVVPLMALSFDEYYALGIPLSDEFNTMNFPDPAEYSSDASKRSDFTRDTAISVTFTAGNGNQDQTATIPLVDDDFNEAIEGFFAVILTNEVGTIPETVVEFERVVTVVNIEDDDTISIGFENDAYTFLEGGDRDIIIVTKGEGITEQNTSLLVQAIPLSAFEGSDYNFPDVFRLNFLPEENNLTVPLDIITDQIPEGIEMFSLSLSKPVEDTSTNIGIITASTSITIIDNDNAIVGFDQESYTVLESNGSLTVCVDLINEEDVEFTVIANILTDENTAEENDDFVPIGSNVFVDLESTDGRRQRCYTIAIIDDDDIEPNETFLVELRPNSLFTPPNVVFMPGQITVTIIDDDEPITTMPPFTQPPATPPPSTQPPATSPPSTQPPATSPPSTQPPTNPPSTRPPTTPPPTSPPSIASPCQSDAGSSRSSRRRKHSGSRSHSRSRSHVGSRSHGGSRSHHHHHDHDESRTHSRSRSHGGSRSHHHHHDHGTRSGTRSGTHSHSTDDMEMSDPGVACEIEVKESASTTRKTSKSRSSKSRSSKSRSSKSRRSTRRKSRKSRNSSS